MKYYRINEAVVAGALTATIATAIAATRALLSGAPLFTAMATGYAIGLALTLAFWLLVFVTDHVFDRREEEATRLLDAGMRDASREERLEATITLARALHMSIGAEATARVLDGDLPANLRPDRIRR